MFSVQQPPSRPLADDQAFLESLADLDRGLTDQGDELRPASSKRQRPRAAAFEPPDEPLQLLVTPRSAAVAPTMPDSVDTVRELSAAPVDASGRASSADGSPRPLLERFPPSSSGHREPPAPALGLAAPPRISRRTDVAPRERAASEAAVTPESFYGLGEQPFSLSTDPKFLYHSTAHDEAAQALLSAIGRHDGLVVLTGDAGTGKTTLCRAVVEELDRRTLTSLVLDPCVSVDELLQAVLVDFGVVSREEVPSGRLSQAIHTELFVALREFFESLVQVDAFPVILIDEAHNLSVSALQEIGALLDLNARQRLLQIVLVGQPALLHLLERAEVRAVQQRVAVRARLMPLAADDVLGYVQHRLMVAGGDGRIEFDPPAIARLHDVTSGVPRLVNIVCNRALTIGYHTSASIIDEGLIESAAHDAGVAAPEARVRRIVRAAASAVALVVLMGVGAGAAAWVFHAPLARAVVRWERVPAPPPPPGRAVAPPLAPVPVPAGAASLPPTAR